MTFRYLGGRLAVAVLLANATLSTPALAALGSDADSVSADSNALHGQLRSAGFVQYDRHQITTGALVVNEYVTRSGQVFAISWQGPVPPNLQQLLGTYFARVQSAAAAVHRTNPGIHRQFSLVQSDLVVVNTGRLRAFRGYAYLPALVPAGLSLSDLQ
jgi:hypothetical protein